MYDEAAAKEAAFNSLAFNLGVQPDRRGWCHIPCPNCGAFKKGKGIFSFSQTRGSRCFMCDSRYTLRTLVQHFGIDTGQPVPVKYRARPKRAANREPEWKRKWKRYLHKYINHPHRYQRWYEYKRLGEEVCDEYRLGVGVLPEYSSWCRHERLIVPIIHKGKMIGIRGRRIACDCEDKKWTVASGTKPYLYNWQKVTQQSVVCIVENPIDAIMIGLVSQSIGVATLSVSYWKDAWATFLAKNARKIWVIYDNDLPGNGGANKREEMIKDWQQHHPECKDPGAITRGIPLVERLQKMGMNAVLYDWEDSPAKCDVGDLIKAKLN